MIYYIVYETRSKRGWRILETNGDLDDYRDLEKFINEFNKQNGESVITFWKKLNESDNSRE